MDVHLSHIKLPVLYFKLQPRNKDYNIIYNTQVNLRNFIQTSIALVSTCTPPHMYTRSSPKITSQWLYTWWNCWCTLPLSHHHHYTMDHNQNAALHAYVGYVTKLPLMHTIEQEWQHFLWLTAWESVCPACVTNTPHTYVHVGAVQYTSTSSLQPILNAEI